MAESMLMKGRPMHMLSTNGGTNKRIGSVRLKRVMHSWHARPRASSVLRWPSVVSWVVAMVGNCKTAVPVLAATEK